jgi:hypothetical protein
VRALAVERDGSALIALARFRDERDLPLVLAALARDGPREGDRWNAQLAAAEFPHPKVRSAVVAVPADHRTDAWYGAVAAYEDAEAATLLEDAWREGGRTADLFEGLRRHRVEPFAPLLLRLWLEARELDEAVLSFLFARDPKGTLDRIERQLLEDVDRAPWNGLDPMLDLLGRERPDRLDPVIAAALAGTDMTSMHALARRAADLKRDAFVEPLFRLFESAAPYHPRYYAAQAILCYGRPDLDRRLAAAVERAQRIQEGEPKERLRALVEKKPRRWADDE